jgi:hypothetical protein
MRSKIAVADGELEIPAHGPKDHLGSEWSPLELLAPIPHCRPRLASNRTDPTCGAAAPKPRNRTRRQHRQPGLAHARGVRPGAGVGADRLRQPVGFPVLLRRRWRDRRRRDRLGLTDVQLKLDEHPPPRPGRLGALRLHRAMAQHDLALRRQASPFRVGPHRVGRRLASKLRSRSCSRRQRPGDRPGRATQASVNHSGTRNDSTAIRRVLLRKKASKKCQPQMHADARGWA